MSVSTEVATLFLDELAKRRIDVKLDGQGNYTISVHGSTLNISLENLSRDFQRDRDPKHIVAFVDAITQLPELPSWEDAERRIRWQPEPANHHFGDTLRTAVSDDVALVLVYVDPSEAHIQWLTAADAQRWNKTRDDLMTAARRNMDDLLRETKVEAQTIDEHRLGMLNNRRVAFKAALLSCANLRDIVEPIIGWPLFAVMPCRDFVYVLNQQDKPLLGRMGGVVLREHQKSGYPVSTEVFAIDDDGMRAIGNFQQPTAEPPAREDGLKVIRYRGGIVTFRIPAGWTEEYEEEGGGTFYDKNGCGTTLRLNVLSFSSKTPVTMHTAMKTLQQLNKEQNGTISDLGNGNALQRYTKTSEDSEGPLTIHYWQIANPVPPNYMRIAIFSFTVPEELGDNEDVVAEIALLDRELLDCCFADVIGK